MKNDRRDKSGRYSHARKCDACGRSTYEEDHLTDDEVCEGTDGPGFWLCARPRCNAKYADLPVEERRALFSAQREKNEGATK